MLVNAAGAHVDTAYVDRVCEKALTADENCRYTLAAGFFRRATEEALLLHGDTFVSTFFTLQRAASLRCQSQLLGVTREEKAALNDQAWALASSCLPLIIRRMDDNTMLPGRGTAVELAFFKRFTATKQATFDGPPLSTRHLQLVGLSLGYVTAVLAADVWLGLLSLRHNDNSKAQAFVLRVVDYMLPATRSLASIEFAEEVALASNIEQVLSGAFPTYNATFVAILRAKWTAAAMVQMRREHRLMDASEKVEKAIKDGETSWRADVSEHGLKHCALPSCDKREVCVRQFGSCSRCRSEWYCSAEHGALHWKEHKPTCRATTAAQQATEACAGAA